MRSGSSRTLRSDRLVAIVVLGFSAALSSATRSPAQEPLPTVVVGASERGAAPPLDSPPSQESLSPQDEQALRSPSHVQESTGTPPSEIPSISSSIPALGNFKKAMIDRGFNLRLNYTGEVFGNPSGGVKRRAIYEGLLEMVLDSDLDKIAGMRGLAFHINAYQIHGRGLSTCCIPDYSTISSIEARAATRLFDVWFEQSFFDDKASIRIGRLAADSDFFISDFGSLFINGTYGWPTMTAADLASGGPAYPLAAPGVRLKLAPSDRITLLAAIFDGDPTGAGLTGQPEIRDPAGLSFRLKDPPLLIGEAQYNYAVGGGASPGLPGTVKLGAWRHFGKFDDEHFGRDRRSLLDPSGIGAPLIHRGDFGVYGVIDQLVWSLSKERPTKGVGAFARLSAGPSNRNLMDFYAEGGINFIGLWPERPDDVFGVAAGYSRISPSVRGLDRDAALFAGAVAPIRDHEIAFELTYQAQIVPGWIIQPDFQYIVHPGGGVAAPAKPILVGRIHDAAVLGLRATIKY
jgi:porin